MMNFPHTQFPTASPSHSNRTKVCLLVFSLFGLAFGSVNAGRASFHILDSSSYEKSSRFKPILKENEKNSNFVDVRIPFGEGRGRACWLVITTEPLDRKMLNFRSIAWGYSMPDYIQSFVRLRESPETAKKRQRFVEFTISKKLLMRCYVYSDYDTEVLDGGPYSTYNLPKYRVEQGGAEQPATAPEPKSEGNSKPNSEPEVRPR